MVSHLEINHHYQERRNRNRTGQKAKYEMLELFFDLSRNVHTEFILEGVLVNSHHYKEILHPLYNSISILGFGTERTGGYYKMMPLHTALCLFKRSQLKNRFCHPPTLSDFAPCSFFFFPV
jgi:hypothetical protein